MDIQQALARFRVTVESFISKGHALVESMQQQYQAQKWVTSEAQRANHDRDSALESLDDWMGGGYRCESHCADEGAGVPGAPRAGGSFVVFIPYILLISLSR